MATAGMPVETHGDLVLYLADATGPQLCSEADALDLLGETYGTGAAMIVVPVERLAPEFFDLSTRLAGHFFQKLQNYRMRLVVLGDIAAVLEKSRALRDFVTETNRVGQHLFVPDRAALLASLRGKA